MDVKELQLNSLLEVTRAVNDNQPEESLYRIFYLICISNLRHKKVALIVKEEDELIVKQSKGLEFSEKSLLDLLSDDNIKDTRIEKAKDWDVTLPISHHGTLLAFVLLSVESTDENESQEEFKFLRTLANILMVAIENKRFSRKELKRLAVEKELEIASRVQGMLIPKELPQHDTHTMCATYLPHKTVGGDYYDVIDLSEDEFIYCIADVSGKGIPAALLMSNFQASLRVLVRQNISLEKMVEELNLQLVTNTGGSSFVTMFLAKVNIETSKMVFINAGHNPSLLLRNGNVTSLSGGSTVLGALDELPFIEKQEIEIKKGDFIFNYTDGLTEISNDAGEEYEIERLSEFIKKANLESLPLFHKYILVEIEKFKENQDFFDDFTILSLQL